MAVLNEFANSTFRFELIETTRTEKKEWAEVSYVDMRMPYSILNSLSLKLPCSLVGVIYWV
jgi:hypothetical protein